MKTNSFIQRLLICLTAGLVCGKTFLRVGDRFLTFILPTPAVIGISVAITLGSLLYAFIWHRHDRKDGVDNVKINAFWVGAIRYGIAFDLAMFGFQKIFHLQFFTPLGMLDEPFSSFSGQWLTWSYFGRSYGFVCAIAASQILGSMLLLFSRTRLLGVIVLLPVMINIILIDYFYELDLGVLIHALILLAGLLYLLALDYDRLVDFFLKHKSVEASYRKGNVFVRHALRLSILFIPLLLIAKNGSRNNHPDLKGKYVVTDVKLNGKLMTTPTCSDSLLTLVYFDIANECLFEFNSQKRRMFGTYSLDESQESIHITWHYPLTAKDKFTGLVRRKSASEIELTGQIRQDSIRAKLKKIL